MILDEKLAVGDVIVLDGAIGSEIGRLGGKMHPVAWCGVANVTDPDIVRQVHEAYLAAGADVITANTFSNCRHVLAAAGYGDQAVAVTRRAVELAREARDRVAPNREVAIAGSLSNHVAWIPGTVATDLPTPEEEAANYREIADTLAEAGCDLLLMEMMLETEHSVRLMEAAVATGLPVWTGMSTSRGRDGKMVGWHQGEEDPHLLPDDYEQGPTQPLETIIDTLAAYDPQVLGIMHSSVKSMAPGLDVLFERWRGPVMAYPEANGYDAVTRSPLPVGPDDFAAYCRGWVESGVQIIGGCCGTTIHHIRAMVDALPERPGARPSA